MYLYPSHSPPSAPLLSPPLPSSPLPSSPLPSSPLPSSPLPFPPLLQYYGLVVEVPLQVHLLTLQWIEINKLLIRVENKFELDEYGFGKAVNVSLVSFRFNPLVVYLDIITCVPEHHYMCT